MMDQAALLRKYHRALGAEIWPDRLAGTDAIFWRLRGITASGPLKAATTAIWDAHVARVEGRGSDAACDTALNEALRSIGP